MHGNHSFSYLEHFIKVQDKNKQCSSNIILNWRADGTDQPSWAAAYFLESNMQSCLRHNYYNETQYGCNYGRENKCTRSDTCLICNSVGLVFLCRQDQNTVKDSNNKHSTKDLCYYSTVCIDSLLETSVLIFSFVIDLSWRP
jgi:hypothetical protein